MSIKKDERYDLLKILFQEQSKAILNSHEFRGRASLSRSDLKEIDGDYNNIASFAAAYFSKKFPSIDNITEEKIKEALSAAILFHEQSKEILNSQEFRSRASLSKSDLKEMDRNCIASHSAAYFLKKYPSINDITEENIKEALLVALLACLGDGKKR